MNCLVQFFINIVLFPFYLVGGILFLTVWGIFTLTGIGPLIQLCLNQRDAKYIDRDDIVSKHNDITVITIPSLVNAASGGSTYQVVARFTVPENCDTSIPPVAMPNGLGATLVLTSCWHEELVRRGYRVLSFDRLGVGFSSDNPTGIPPTAPDVIREMDFVMNNFLPSNTKWILVGGSMGSIVAQCYISAFPNKVVGFLNMDGLPYPFIVAKKNFEFAAKLYKFYTYIMWTGIFRPFISMGLKSMEAKLTTQAFTKEVLYAQLNQTRFFGNIGLEMLTMMELCEYGTVSWGIQDINKLEPHLFDSLVRAEPDEIVEYEESKSGGPPRRFISSYRSPSERGSSWASKEDVDAAVNKLIQLRDEQGMEFVEVENTPDDSENVAVVPTRIISSPNLPHVWKDLVVRVMSGRNHDFGNESMNKFYTTEMKDLAAAEHALHARLALHGRRSVYPKTAHNVMFLLTDEICSKVDEIKNELKLQAANNMV